MSNTQRKTAEEKIYDLYVRRDNLSISECAFAVEMFRIYRDAYADIDTLKKRIAEFEEQLKSTEEFLKNYARNT